jgi:uncharacterized protein involved in exopolysaccharide biosynthesis
LKEQETEIAEKKKALKERELQLREMERQLDEEEKAINDKFSAIQQDKENIGINPSNLVGRSLTSLKSNIESIRTSFDNK